MCDIVVNKFTFAISSPDEFLYQHDKRQGGVLKSRILALATTLTAARGVGSSTPF